MVKPRRRATRDNRKFYTILGAVGLVGALAITYAATRSSGSGAMTIDPSAVSGPAEGYVMGSPSAPVEIMEYGDFECGACAQFSIVTEPQIRERLVQTGMARFRFFDFPLNIHQNTIPAHLAAACANDQGKFWEMHDQLFQNQDKWNGQATRNPQKQFEGFGKTIGLDMDAWETCYDDRRHLPKIQASVAQGNKLRVSSTPTFIVGNTMVAGALGYDRIKAMVDSVTRAVRNDKPLIGQ